MDSSNRMLKALLLILALLLACVAAAEEVSGRIDFTERIAPFTGKWVRFSDGFRLYVPGEWARMDITEEQAQAGLFYSEGNGGGDSLVGEVSMGVAVSYARADTLHTLDDLAAEYSAAGFTGIDKLDINGILAVSFCNAPGNYRGVAFYHPLVEGYVMTVYVSPSGVDSQRVSDVGSAILCSLTPTAGEAEP